LRNALIAFNAVDYSYAFSHFQEASFSDQMDDENIFVSILASVEIF